MPKVLLLSGDADYNVGDAAIVEALGSALREARGNLSLSVVADSPASGWEAPSFSVLPKGFIHSPAQWLAASRHDLLVVAGGGLFQDDDSRVKMPYWALRLAALRAVNSRLAGHSLGAGPLSHPESRFFGRIACNALRSVTVRDRYAAAALAPCMRVAPAVVPDSAFMLHAAPQEAASNFLRANGLEGRVLIGVCMRRWFHRLGGFVPHRVRKQLGGGEAGRESMDRLLENMAQALKHLAHSRGAAVLLLPSYHAPHEGDVDVSADLAARLQRERVDAVCAIIRAPRLFKAVTARLQLLISARMHPLILAASGGASLLGLGYNKKFAGCLDLLEIPEQLLWLRDMTDAHAADRIIAAAEAAVRRSDVTATAARLGATSRSAAHALLNLLP
jgi:polysaccharide pyruvyl transferase WcaK-like protein